MSKKHFRFKQFNIRHDKCAMKVGTDGVLLGAWCDVKGVSRVLDIGTGSGLIALMLAQRNAECQIDAVEIDGQSFRQATENASASPWPERINIIQCSFQDFSVQAFRKYDLIVTNPPYFRNSLPNPGPERTAARHSASLGMSDLLEGVKELLDDHGRFCMIMPVNEAVLFTEKAGRSDLYCRKMTFVLPNPGKPPKRYLLEFSRFDGRLIKSDLVIELDRRHHYSPEFKKLTEDFYLYFRY